MAYRPQVLKRLTGKSSVVWAFIAFAVVIAIIYGLIKTHSHNSTVVETSELSLLKPPASPAIIYEGLNGKRIGVSEKEPLFSIDQKLETKSLIIKKAVTAAVSASSELSNIAAVDTLAPVKASLVSTPPPKKDNVWQVVKPRSGDSMATIFHRLGLSAKNLHEVLNKNPYSKALTSIKPSQELHFLINKNHLEKLVIAIDYVQTLTIYRSGNSYKTQIDSKKTTKHERFATATVKGSLYTTAQHNTIPTKLIHQMTDILGKQIDFVHSVHSGDQFSIAYEAEYVDDKMVGIGDIIAVSYTNGKKTAQAMRHLSAQGDKNYYSPEGESFKKAFSRYPVKFTHISSTFTTSRYHPILRYRRAHKGIDLAAPIGTPIQSTGDGVIASIGRHNGYGNMIKIRHDSTYSTVYGHMLKFQKGLSKGSHVKRGQVIGYVGQTGLATGPHCHFELHVKNQPKNPTTTYLPTAASVPSRELGKFKAKSRALFTRLKVMETVSVAKLNKDKTQDNG